jgi:uncharacterized protein YlxP (DUF503 family)
MPIGLLTLEIHIPEAHSLKDKRQVIRSLKDRLRNKYNVAVAELEFQDTWKDSVVGVVTLSGNAAHVEKSLRTIFAESERLLGRDLVGHDMEVL